MNKSAVSLVVLAMSIMPLLRAQQSTAFMRQQQTTDLAHRDPGIHWPGSFDPARAAQFSHNHLFIHASCEHVFARMAKVSEWPDWFILVKNVSVQGAVQTPALGQTLLLSIFNTPITAKITEWVPGERISWLPEGVAPSQSSHYHTWHFTPSPGGCEVVTEEVGVGAADQKLGAEGSFSMHRAHDLWLASLRYTSE